MSALAVRSLALLAAALSPAWPATSTTTTYTYPIHVFSLPIPPGWTVETGDQEAALISSGNANTIVKYVPDGGDNPEMVAKFRDAILGEKREHRAVRNGPAQLGTAAGTFEIYSGANSHGVATLWRVVSAPTGTAAMLVVSFCPAAEWDQYKVAIGIMERGLRFVTGGQNGTYSALPPPAPTGARGGAGAPAANPSAARSSGPGMASAGHGVPNGFRIAGRSGEAGQALTATFTGGRSAKATFQSAFRIASGYFDQPPVMGSAVEGPHDQLVEGLFRATWHGAPVRGLMVATIGEGAGYVGMIFDREDQFSRSLPVLSRQMKASLPAPQANARQAAAPAHPHPPQRLTQTALLDGSGSIGLPAGWQITGSYKGCVDASGPDGAIASLGGSMIAFTNPLPGTPANVISGPYRDPIHALPLMWDYAVLQGALRSRRATLEIIESAPVPTEQGQAAYIAFHVYNPQGEDYRYLAMVQTAPVDETEWMAYLSVVGSSTNHFAELFPTLWAMWKSWSINSSVFKERMDAALQSMHETFAIMQGIDREKQRATEVGNEGWDQVIRGVTTIQNLPGGGAPYEINNNGLYLLQSLGLEGTGYRVVSPAELVGNGG